MRNKEIRRLVLETLFHNGSMTKGQMFDHLKTHYRLLKEPTEHSLSSIMQKNCQIVKVGKTVVHTQTGSSTKHALFDVDRVLIDSYQDLVLTMPIGIVTKDELEAFGKMRCHTCARERLRPPFDSGGKCFQCHNSA